ncbi:MAG: DegV family EDD domain-containing protein [Oscillospiraceae bacterium]|nr:DegV family EDD domain-containing protein [Oscillospiraceae bacterium]
MKKKIGISTDCMCDLPADCLTESGVEIMQFYIHVATGRFLNDVEITSDNIVEYLASGNTFLRSSVPEPEECRAYFDELLTRYDEIIHITTSDKVGLSYSNVQAALELMGDDKSRVALINSGCISTGVGQIVLLAVTLKNSGKTVSEIVTACDAMRRKLAVSFIVPNADYLYRVGYAGPGAKALCRIFKVHPVLCTKNGKLVLKSFRVGSYEKAVLRYIRGELRRGGRIDKRQLFITHAGCPSGLITQVKAKAVGLCRPDSVTVTKASAVISGYFGPGALGVLFVTK